jgi:hypothetical protein
VKKIAFTIVLNGLPFIKKQAEIIPQVFDEWYIVEGATTPVLDTGWCKPIPEKFYSNNFLSNDGTTEFLDSISSDKIKIIRKEQLWNGKVEMCNSFMDKIENSILMQFDVDEIWNIEVLKDVLEYADKNDHFDGMVFKCNYFVGPNLITVGENCYGNNSYEWHRLWKIRNKTYWLSHEPPRVKGCLNFLTRDFTKNKNWVFNHYAYILEAQLKFKENFYGYDGAVNCWNKLQVAKNFPCLLKDYLPWVDGQVQVDKIDEQNSFNISL